MIRRSIVRRGPALLLSFVAAAALSLVCVTPAWADPGNDELETATTVQVNQTVSGTTLSTSDDDFYRFTTPSDGIVQLSLSNAQNSRGGWNVRLRNLDDDAIASFGWESSATSHSGTRVGLPKGTYVVEVSPYSNTSGQRYSLTVGFSAASNWETEFNDGLETADPLAVNSAVKGSTIDSGDDDFYRFTTPSDGIVQLSLSNAQNSRGGWNVRLRDQSDETIASFGWEASATSHSGTRIGLPKGTYTVEVSPYSNTSGQEYTLTAGFTAASNWETEFNDNLSTADTITLGKTINGSSIDSSDDDFYRLVLSKSSTVYLRLTNAQYSRGGWRVYLRDINNNAIVNYDCGADQTSHSSSAIRLDAGTYTFEVSPYSNTSGHEYTLTVSDSPQTQTMYRLYNPYTGEHFYTANAGERDTLKSIGWTYEGVGWVAPLEGDPVYRLFNPYTDDHHYTTSASERDTLKSIGWRYEGVGWRSGGSVPVLRQFNPYVRTATHNYTVSREENDKLVSLGWREEGTGWYAVSAK